MTARCGSRRRGPTGERLFVTTDRLSAFDRILAGVPYKGQVLNQLAAWWFERTADVVANHVVAVPDPNVLIARSATTLPVEVVVRGYITGVTSTSLWKPYAAGVRTIYGHHFPDGLRKNTRAARADRHADDEAAGRLDRPRRAADVGRGRRAPPRRRGPLGARHGGRPRAVPPGPAGRRRGRADPRRHEVRVRPERRRRAAADRRGAHAGLVALLGRRLLRGADGRRRGAREPRQGGRPAGLHRRRLQRRRRSAHGSRRRVDGHLGALHRRLRTPDRARLRARRQPADARIAGVRRGPPRGSSHDP